MINKLILKRSRCCILNAMLFSRVRSILSVFFFKFTAIKFIKNMLIYFLLKTYYLNFICVLQKLDFIVRKKYKITLFYSKKVPNLRLHTNLLEAAIH